MAATRSIELRTEVPGPRSRAILERKERVVADAAGRRVSRSSPRSASGATAHRRRRQHLHRLHRRRRLPERRPLAPAGRRRGAGAARALRPHRLHDRPVRVVRRRSPSGCSRASPISGPAKAAFFNAGTEAVENAVKFARALHGRPAVIALRGRLPRPHAALAVADLEDAPVQGGPRAVRARGLPRAVRRTTTAGPTPATALAALERALRHPGRGRDGRGDRRRAGAGRGRLRRRAAGVHGGSSPDLRRATASCWSSTRCRPASARTGRFFAIEHYDVEPDLITVAKSIAGGPAALGRARPRGDHGRARRRTRSAARTSATRRAGGGPRRARRVRRGGPRRARRRWSARRSARGCCAWQERFDGDRRRPRARRDARDRARPRPRVEGSRARARRRGLRRGVPQRAAAAQAPGIYSNVHPRARAADDRGRASSTEALGVWEQALEHVLG